MENQMIIEKLERKIKNLSKSIIGLTLLWLVSIAAGVLVFLSGIKHPRIPDILRVRGLVVMDEKGTNRVWIGSPVPDPSILGWRHPRGEMSGIILYDEEGNERSGYVTTNGYSNVMLTLDSVAKQHALFIAEPHGSPTLWMWGETRENDFRITVDSDSPDLRLTKEGKVIFQLPDKGEKSK